MQINLLYIEDLKDKIKRKNKSDLNKLGKKEKEE